MSRERVLFRWSLLGERERERMREREIELGNCGGNCKIR